MKTFARFLLFSFTLFILTGGGFAADQDQAGKPAMKNVGVPEFEKLRSDKKNVVLDVRTEKEFAAGHMPGAVNLDVNAPDFDEKVKKLDPSKTYLVHCAAGVRSRKACEKMEKLNFEKLYNLEGGYRAWEKAGNKGEK
jgi:phage shock protein E